MHGKVSLGLFLGEFLFELNFEKEKCIGISNFKRAKMLDRAVTRFRNIEGQSFYNKSIYVQ